MDRIVSLLSRYRAESPILSPNTGKYGLEKARISSFFTQCSTLYVAVALTSSFCTHIWQVIYKRSNPAASQFITVSFHFLFLPTPLARIPTIKIFTQRLWPLWRLKDWSEDMLFQCSFGRWDVLNHWKTESILPCLLLFVASFWI